MKKRLDDSRKDLIIRLKLEFSNHYFFGNN